MPSAEQALISEYVILGLSTAIESAIFLTLHIILSVMAIRALWRLGFDSRPRQLQVSVVITILVLTITCDVMRWTTTIEAIATWIETYTLDAGQTPSHPYHPFQTNLTVWLLKPGGLLYLVADAIILWRGWNLWTYRRIYLLAPVFFTISACGLSLAFLLTNTVRTDSVGKDMVVPLSYAAMICSFSANAWMTGMIAYQAFSHRQVMRATLVTRRSNTWKILLYLTESGVIYAILQLITLVLYVALQVAYSDTLYKFQQHWVIFYVHVSYPAVVVLMVVHNVTLADGSGITFALKEHSVNFSTLPVSGGRPSPDGLGRETKNSWVT